MRERLVVDVSTTMPFGFHIEFRRGARSVPVNLLPDCDWAGVSQCVQRVWSHVPAYITARALSTYLGLVVFNSYPLTIYNQSYTMHANPGDVFSYDVVRAIEMLKTVDTPNLDNIKRYLDGLRPTEALQVEV